MTTEHLHIGDDIVERMSRDDERAFNTIYSQYVQRLFFFALRYVPESDAKDVVSEAFINLWEKRADFSHLPAVQRYLFVIVRNRCLNILKKKELRLKKQIELVHQLERAEAADLDMERLTGDLVDYVYKEVDNLPARQKEIFLLSFREGLKPRQIAERLNLSVQTVSNQKLTTIRLLRQVLGERAHLLNMLLFLLLKA